MKVTKFILLALLGLVFCCFVEGLHEESDDGSSIETDTDIVEENPDYIAYEDREESEKENESQEVEGEDTKSAIGNALAQSRKAPRRTVRFLQKHKLEITIALTAFAFRRELAHFLWTVVSKPVRDPKTGEIVGRAVQVSPTAILKMALFLNLMFKMQQSDGGKANPLVALLIAGRNPVLRAFLLKLLAPGNPAYIPPIRQHYTFERVNERYQKDGMALQKAINPMGSHGDLLTSMKSGNETIISMLLSGKGDRRNEYNETIVLMDLTGLDSSVSQMAVLRDEVSFLLSEYQAKAMEAAQMNNNETTSTPEVELEVVVLLESPGGSASDYALASQQILRLRNQPGIKVTICVDKVAASGGYMIACCSSEGRLFAAPLAVLGSIGVIGQSVNIQKTLEGWGVQPLVFRGGRDKSPVGLIGEVTKEGLAKVQLMVDDVHRAFKRHVVEARPVVAPRIEEVATGDVWLGYDALDLGLIDRIVTSDEYITERMQNGARVLRLMQLEKPKFPFSRPTATSSLLSQDQTISTRVRSVVVAIGNLRALLEKATKSLSSFVADDVQAVTRAIATNPGSSSFNKESL